MLASEAKILGYLAKITPIEKEGPFFRRLKEKKLLPFIKSNELDLLYAMGASTEGGRYTRKGSLVKCLYVSESELTAKAECYRLRNLSTEELERAHVEPGCAYSVNVKMEGILDLTDQTLLDNLETTIAELSQEFRGAPIGVEIPSQTLGYLAFNCNRFDGIKYHSAVRPGFINYVVFRDRLKVSATVVEI